MTTPKQGWPRDLASLPPLMTFESFEAAEIVLPLRFACPWHDLVWYPVERDDDILYGLTARTIPEWRRFSLSELMRRYGGHPVLIDKLHEPRPAAEVPEVVARRLLDLTTFFPVPVPRP